MFCGWFLSYRIPQCAVHKFIPVTLGLELPAVFYLQSGHFQMLPQACTASLCAPQWLWALNPLQCPSSQEFFFLLTDIFFHSRETAQQVADLILWFMLTSHVLIFFSVPFSTKYIPLHTGFLGNQLSKTEIDWVENRILQKFHFAMFNNERTQLPGVVVNFCNQNVWTFPL